jgi:hypothetical protein
VPGLCTTSSRATYVPFNSSANWVEENLFGLAPLELARTVFIAAL